MKKIYTLYILLILFTIACSCDVLNKEKDSTLCEPSYFSDNFERYDIGPLPNKLPYQYYGSHFGVIEAEVVNTDAIEGSKCLKVNRSTVSGDPYYCAVFLIGYGCFNEYTPLYLQFYVKWKAMGQYIFFTFSQASYVYSFDYSKQTGFQFRNTYDILDKDTLTNNTWYRIELAINRIKEGSTEIKIFSENGDIPLNKATTFYNTKLPIKNGQKFFSFDPMHDDLRNDPTLDLDNYSVFLDDFSISDDSSILKVGFSQ